MIDLDLATTPFTVRGSVLVFSLLAENRGRPEPGTTLRLRTIDQRVMPERRAVFELTLEAGSTEVAFSIRARPGELVLRSRDRPSARVAITFATPDRIRIRGRGCRLRLSACAPARVGFARPHGPDLWEWNDYERRLQLMIGATAGTLQTLAAFGETAARGRAAFIAGPTDSAPIWECFLERFEQTWSPPTKATTFDVARDAVVREFERWLASTPRVSRSLGPARELAAYVQWSSLLGPSGLLQREGMLMSKHWMTWIWSWDHCFNAVALAAGQPALAWDQWATPFDHQHPNGALPDCVNPHERLWNFTKPPVHGWALRHMLQRHRGYTRAQLGWAFDRLVRWTEWWLRERDEDGDGIPQYHHGNDSGWDNATVFAAGPPVESPDLAAYLIVQMDVIADLAARLGRRRLAHTWRRRADELTARFLAHSWKDDRFIATRPGTHESINADSLITFLPLILGSRLPLKARQTLVAGLVRADRFITSYGVATEALTSPAHAHDSYWRGPVWAPSTLLIVDGLRACGETRLATRIARGFVRAVQRARCMAENFDPRTGAPLRDPAYTWTASVFLILAEELRQATAHS